mgnify:CR=1 FL=1
MLKTDGIVGGVHFFPDDPPDTVAKKALRVNLSDLAAKGADAVYQDAIDIRDGGGNGSIIGRNSFQRKREDALAMLAKLVDIYKGKA